MSELEKIDFAEQSETIKDTHHWIDIAYRDVDGCYYGD